MIGADLRAPDFPFCMEKAASVAGVVRDQPILVQYWYDAEQSPPWILTAWDRTGHQLPNPTEAEHAAMTAFVRVDAVARGFWRAGS